MQSMKKVEIVFGEIYLTKVLKLLDKHNIIKYSLIKDIEGRGSHGLVLNDDITCVGSNDYIFTLCEEEQFLSLHDELKSFIKRFGGKCFVSDVSVLN